MPPDESGRDAYEFIVRELASLKEAFATVARTVARPMTRASIEEIADQHIYVIDKVIIVMPDQYVNHGQVGAFGNQARSDHNAFHQIVPGREVQASEMAAQLEAVRLQMRQLIGPNDIDREVEIGNLALVERSAKAGDEEGMLKYLKLVGRWTLSVAKSVAADLVVAAVKAHTGLS